MVDPCFVTSDNSVQEVVTFFIIAIRILLADVQAHFYSCFLGLLSFFIVIVFIYISLFNNLNPTGNFMCHCFVRISEQTANIALHIINILVFKTEVESVYSAVRTGALNKAVCASSLEG